MTRQSASEPAPGTARPPRRRVLAAATGHPAPGAPWSRTAGWTLGQRRRARPGRVAMLPPQWLLNGLAAGLLAATGRPPPRSAPPPPPGWRPGTEPRTGDTTVAWAAPPLRSPLCSLSAAVHRLARQGTANQPSSQLRMAMLERRRCSRGAEEAVTAERSRSRPSTHPRPTWRGDGADGPRWLGLAGGGGRGASLDPAPVTSAVQQRQAPHQNCQELADHLHAGHKVRPQLHEVDPARLNRRP